MSIKRPVPRGSDNERQWLRFLAEYIGRLPIFRFVAGPDSNRVILSNVRPSGLADNPLKIVLLRYARF